MRRHGLTPQQLFNWRRQARREAEKGTGALPFVPVVVETPSAASPPAESVESKPTDARPPVIELDIAGSSVWIWHDAEAAMVTAIIGALKAAK